MNTIKLLASGLVLATLAWPGRADAAEFWGVCHDCGSNASAFAAGIPGNQFGQHTVNVFDETDQALSSFAVTIYYDYEFRAWTRFARAVTPSAEARTELEATLAAKEFLESLPALLGETEIDVADVQTFLGARGSFDGLVNDALFHSMEIQGLLQRFLNSGVQIATTAGKLLSSNFKPQFRIHFSDGSSVLVTAEVIANDLSNLSIQVVDGSAKLPDGTQLPHDAEAFDGFFVTTGSAATIRALADWAMIVGGYRINSQLNLGGSSNFTYVFRCTENECILTARRNP